MRFQPCFSLRTLLAIVAVAAIILAWISAQRRLIAERHEALEWVQNGVPCTFQLSDKNVPFGLWLAGERESAEFIYVQDDMLKLTEKRRTKQLKELFPETTIWVYRNGERVVSEDAMADR